MTSVLQKEIEQSVTGRTESADSDSFVQTGFVQLLQENAVSVRMPRTNAEGLSRGLGRCKERDLLLARAEGVRRLS